MRKYLPFVVLLNVAILATMGIYSAIDTLDFGLNEDVEEILLSFKSRSKLCDQPLPSLESYKARFGTEKISKWLWNYVKLHHEIMCAEEPTVPRRYVIYHASAGLANRMQSLFSTFVFAVLSDRALIVDWRPQSENHACYVNDLFDLPDFDWSYELIRPLTDDSSIDEHSIRLAFDDPLLLDPFLCSNLSEYYYRVPIINIHTDEYYTPMFEHGYYHDTLQQVFEGSDIFTEVAPFLFRMTQEIQQRVDEFKKEAFGEVGCSLGLQVRQNGIGGIYTNNVHWSCARQVINNSEDMQTGKIFLASDVQDVRNQARKIFGDKLVYYTLPVRHQKDQTCEEVQAALIDLMLLAKCKSLVVTSWSSFGAVAHTMSGVKPMIAIYKEPGASKVSSIKASADHERNYCLQINWSRLCYLEWVHVRHLSCFSRDMFDNEPCCELGFCQDCLHHEPLASSFLKFYHWSASKIMFTMILIAFTSFGTYRSLLYYFIRRKNYHVFARNISLGVLIVLLFLWFLLVALY